MPPKPQPGISPVVQALAEHARRQGVTAYAIAKAQDMHISTVQKALDGEVSPSIATLEAIASALHATITVHFGVNTPSSVGTSSGAPPTGATRPSRSVTTTAMRSTEATPAGSGPLTRKQTRNQKSPAATFLPGELEPVTTGAVTRKRKPTT